MSPSQLRYPLPAWFALEIMELSHVLNSHCGSTEMFPSSSLVQSSDMSINLLRPSLSSLSSTFASTLAIISMSASACKHAVMRPSPMFPSDVLGYALVTRVVFDLPDRMSTAVTLIEPPASTAKAISICGRASAVAGECFRSNDPRRILSFVARRSPSKTLMVTMSWSWPTISNFLALYVGVTESRGTICVTMPPFVSTPNERRVESS